MPVPKSITKKMRFEVFRRDGFTCRYCGEKAPNVKLHVDHITPVSMGGSNDFSNLTTACKDCNYGKGSTVLTNEQTPNGVTLPDFYAGDKYYNEASYLANIARKSGIATYDYWRKVYTLFHNYMDKEGLTFEECLEGINYVGSGCLDKLDNRLGYQVFAKEDDKRIDEIYRRKNNG